MGLSSYVGQAAELPQFLVNVYYAKGMWNLKAILHCDVPILLWSSFGNYVIGSSCPLHKLQVSLISPLIFARGLV